MMPCLSGINTFSRMLQSEKRKTIYMLLEETKYLSHNQIYSILYTPGVSLRKPPLDLPLIRNLIKRPIMPLLNLLIMTLHLLRDIFPSMPLQIHIRRLLPRRHGRVRLVRGDALHLVDIARGVVVGGFGGCGGVGLFGGGFGFGGVLVAVVGLVAALSLALGDVGGWRACCFVRLLQYRLYVVARGTYLDAPWSV